MQRLIHRSNFLCWTVLAAISSSFPCLLIPAQVPLGFNPRPVFDDEFNGTALDPFKWDYRELGSRGAAIQTKDAIRVANGYLTIKTYSTVDPDGKVNVYSGMISTEKSFKMTYGYWEASIRFHYNPGTQPAFWVQSPSIGTPVGSPEKAGVEMDIFEHTSKTTEATTYDHAFHWDGYEVSHKVKAQYFTRPNLKDGKFHTFGLEWTPAGYRFFVDGQIDWDLTALEVPVSQVAEYIILSTEVYRNIPSSGYGNPESSTATFDVDYVRAYSYVPK